MHSAALAKDEMVVQGGYKQREVGEEEEGEREGEGDENQNVIEE